MSERNIHIHVPMLARVEGEGALTIDIENGALTKVNLSIYEPPRYFEKFLEGKHYNDVIDIVARICGICPVAYQVSAVLAFENLFGIEIEPWARDMRRVFYCGEWIESHALHIHLLAAPDFLGFGSAPEMAKLFPEEVKRGLILQHTGNQLIKLLGGRSVHPVGLCVGGFHRAPEQKEIDALLLQLEKAIPLAEDLIDWVATLPISEQQQTFESVSLGDTGEYTICDSRRVVSDTGENIEIDEFDQHFHEQHQPYSTALHCLHNGQPYLVGPLARLNNNAKYLPTTAKEKLRRHAIAFPSKNLFHSAYARATEIYFALIEAERILQNYTAPIQTKPTINVKSGIAIGATEAPRGTLWHRYKVDANGLIVNARIVPPTSQNQARIEQDLRDGLNDFGLNQTEDAIRLHAEKIIRNYDPCISCATHFLDLRVNRR